MKKISFVLFMLMLSTSISMRAQSDTFYTVDHQRVVYMHSMTDTSLKMKVATGLMDGLESPQMHILYTNKRLVIRDTIFVPSSLPWGFFTGHNMFRRRTFTLESCSMIDQIPCVKEVTFMHLLRNKATGVVGERVASPVFLTELILSFVFIWITFLCLKRLYKIQMSLTFNKALLLSVCLTVAHGLFSCLVLYVLTLQDVPIDVPAGTVCIFLVLQLFFSMRKARVYYKGYTKK